MKFWKEHTALRITLIALLFILGLVLVLSGWRMTGQLAGMGLMVLGILLLLAALYVYNKSFQDPHEKSGGKKK